MGAQTNVLKGHIDQLNVQTNVLDGQNHVLESQANLTEPKFHLLEHQPHVSESQAHFSKQKLDVSRIENRIWTTKFKFQRFKKMIMERWLMYLEWILKVKMDLIWLHLLHHLKVQSRPASSTSSWLSYSYWLGRTTTFTRTFSTTLCSSFHLSWITQTFGTTLCSSFHVSWITQIFFLLKTINSATLAWGWFLG